MYTNALIEEKSPYLKQHAHNPVAWMPWSDAAFAKARRENKPIFLSIGYSTCHWCHVMAHESFEDESVAELLNREFVPVKVDREERPDVDRIYMLFVQASTGSGGWPMSVWLTPELKPFFGGTYFPPDSRYGRPGFRDLLEQLARAWKQERERVEASGANVEEQLRALASPAKATLEPDKELLGAAFWPFRRMFDTRWGGFGGAPKFPRPAVLTYLLRYYAAEHNDEALEMVVDTLRHMAAGGMHDQLGGGFHRYSVDDRWFVPHFEKMLYDQAQLAIAYLEAFQITREERLAEVAAGILDYVARDLTDQSGGFYSAEDADSPDPEHPSHAREGAFYVWRRIEIEALLGDRDAAVFSDRYGVENDGNVEQDPHGEFTSRNILFEARTLEQVAGQHGLSVEETEQVLRRGREVLLEARNKRPRPHVDDKILTSWNGLMISAFAKAYMVLGDAKYLEVAEQNASFLKARMYDAATGRLLRRFCDGESAIAAFVDDYAFLAQGLLDLFEASGNAGHLETALDLAERGLNQFEDREGGGFYSTGEGAPDLLLRMKDDYDGAEPSGNSVATDLLLRLAHITGDEKLARSAERSLEAIAPKMKAQPTMAPYMLAALGRWLAVPEQIVIRCADVGAEVRELLARYRKEFRPYATILTITDQAAERLREWAPFLGGLERTARLTIYECRNFACELPKIID